MSNFFVVDIMSFNKKKTSQLISTAATKNIYKLAGNEKKIYPSLLSNLRMANVVH